MKVRLTDRIPSYIVIKESDIHELGLFTKENIEVGTVIGITHIYDTRFLHNYIRTPLGGFYNHSEIPNVLIRKRKFLIKLKLIVW